MSEISSDSELTPESIIETKVNILYGVFKDFPNDAKKKLITCDNFVIMTSCMSKVPHLAIENDDELMTIQKKLCERVKSPKMYVVTYIQFGDTCDNHSRLLGNYDDEETAKNELLADMDTYIKSMQADPVSVNKYKHEVWFDKNYTQGCIWDIHEIFLTKERK